MSVFAEYRITGCPGGSCGRIYAACLCVWALAEVENLVGGLDEEWLSCNYKSITCPEVTVDVECEDFNVSALLRERGNSVHASILSQCLLAGMTEIANILISAIFLTMLIYLGVWN